MTFLGVCKLLGNEEMAQLGEVIGALLAVAGVAKTKEALAACVDAIAAHLRSEGKTVIP